MLTTTQRDREDAVLLAAYPGRMRLAEAEDVFALLDFIQEDYDSNQTTAQQR